MAEVMRKILRDEKQLTAVASNAFAESDPDKSGYINEKELMKVMARVSSALNTPKPNGSQLKEALKGLEQQKDGKLSIQEFILILKSVFNSMLKKLGIDPGAADSKVPEPSKEEEKIEPQMDSNLQMFEKYLHDSGISLVFQIIYTEILTKKIEADNVFTYTAMRLRQIGKEVAHLLPANMTVNITDH